MSPVDSEGKNQQLYRFLVGARNDKIFIVNRYLLSFPRRRESM
jgi:hypothetical protein